MKKTVFLLLIVLVFSCTSVAEPPEIIYEITHPNYEEFIADLEAKNINLDSVEVQRNIMIDIEAIQNSVVYPDYAKENNIEGKVIVRVLIDNQDRVLSVIVEYSDNEYLNGSALEAIYDAEIYSAIGLNGEKTSTYVSIPIRFKLR